MKWIIHKIYSKLKKQVKQTRKIINKKYYLMMFRKKRPIFIVGCGHSGTSIMLSVLGHHPELHAINYETNMFRTQPLDLKKIYHLTKTATKKRLLEKTPRHVYCLEKILCIFPKAKIIVMIRDGRDVACSLAERFGDFEQGIERWLKDNEAWLPHQHHKAIYPLKLEDFLADKDVEILKLFEFLSLSEYPSIFDYHLFKRSFFKTQSVSEIVELKHNQQRSWQINQPLFKNTQRWKSEMALSDIELFKQKANNLLMYFRYETNTNWE